MPQRGIPYVHIGHSNVLYSRSLFSVDICECLPMIQYIRLNGSSNCFLLACMCVRHVSRRFKCNPWYLAFSLWGMSLPFRCTGGHSSRLRVKVTCVDLDSLAQIRHCCSHCSNRYKRKSEDTNVEEDIECIFCQQTVLNSANDVRLIRCALLSKWACI
jgi:hypothetical protein